MESELAREIRLAVEAYEGRGPVDAKELRGRLHRIANHARGEGLLEERRSFLGYATGIGADLDRVNLVNAIAEGAHR